MQRLGRRADLHDRIPFSILGRIGGDATIALALALLWLTALSVSSVGSEAMQRVHICTEVLTDATFSILGRIGGDATCVEPRRQGPALQLSVSSVGSEAMQLPGLSEPGRGILDFQYPRSDRRRCNDLRGQ